MKWIILTTLMVSSSAFSFELKVEMKNINSSRGNMKIALYKGPNGFPMNPNAVFQGEVIDIIDGKAGFTFSGLVEDDYAVAVFHDENNNDRLDTRFRIPKEPFGFSNNPSLLGMPNFRKCKVTVNEDKTIQIYLKNLL